MFYAKKLCVFLKYFEGWATKDVCLVVVSRPSEFWKNLVRPRPRVQRNMLMTFILTGMRRLVSLNKS